MHDESYNQYPTKVKTSSVFEAYEVMSGALKIEQSDFETKDAVRSRLCFAVLLLKLLNKHGTCLGEGAFGLDAEHGLDGACSWCPHGVAGNLEMNSLFLLFSLRKTSCNI